MRSGASGVPLMLAMAAGRDWSGHVPGRAGFQAAIRSGSRRRDRARPAGLMTREEAIAWNLRYEQESGLVVGADGRATYTGILRERLAGFAGSLPKASMSATSMTSPVR